MRQRFFTSSLQGRFIKNLLCNEPIPMYDTVRPGDYIVKNRLYIYNISLIKCIKSGTLEGTGEFLSLDDTYYWASNHINTTHKFTSNTGFYDSETHEWLGDYLRAYRGMKGINLMPFYNCFSGVYTDAFKLRPTTVTVKINNEDSDEVIQKTFSYISVFQTNTSYDTYSQGTEEFNDTYVEQNPYKIFMVPVKLNRTYTIAIDCDSNVRICPAFINHGKLINVHIGTETLSLSSILITNTQPNNDMKPISMDVTNTEFIHPFTINIESKNQTEVQGVSVEEDIGITYEQLLYRYEKYLYLLIQVPRTNTSGLVVLEGDYTEASVNKVFSDEQVDIYKETPVETFESTSTLLIDSNLNPTNNSISKCPWVSYANVPNLIFNDGKLKSVIQNITIDSIADIGFIEYDCKQGSIKIDGVTTSYNIVIYSYSPLLEGTEITVEYYNAVDQEEIYPVDLRDTDVFLDNMLMSKLSLLQFNDNKNYPFTETLIQYLLLNTIDSADENGLNIKQVQKWVNISSSPGFVSGAWTNELRKLIFYKMREIRQATQLDIIGYVDRNTEDILRKNR